MSVSRLKEIFKTGRESAKFNNGFQSKFYSEEPTFLSYTVFFEFSSPFLNSVSSNGESAERYFRRLGDDFRADKVKEFRERLLDLMQNTPYLIKSITGLDGILNYQREEIYLERIIDFNTYETLDLRIASLANLYTDIVWDWKNHRRVIPKNLEYIDFHIIINDIRSLVKYVKSESGEELQHLNPYLPTIAYTFRKSKFYFGNSSSFLSNLSNESPEMATNKFQIACGKFTTENTKISVNDVIKSKTISSVANKDVMNEETHGNFLQNSIKLAKETALQKTNETAHDIAQRSIDTIKNKFSQLNTKNVLFRSEVPIGIDLLTGKQKLNDLIPDFTGNVVDSIFGKPTLPNTQIDNDTLINNIIYSSNKLIGGK